MKMIHVQAYASMAQQFQRASVLNGWVQFVRKSMDSALASPSGGAFKLVIS
jgi:hypothetical protein